VVRKDGAGVGGWPGLSHLGYPERVALGVAILMFVCTVIYAIPQTSILGAILLTAYLGGATGSHVRIGEPFYLPIVVGGWFGFGFFCAKTSRAHSFRWGNSLRSGGVADRRLP